jgi:hypothetical protein
MYDLEPVYFPQHLQNLPVLFRLLPTAMLLQGTSRRNSVDIHRVCQPDEISGTAHYNGEDNTLY